MAWQDDTPFEAIALQFAMSEAEVIALMRENLKTRSFRVWRMRVRGRIGKHLALRQNRTPSHKTGPQITAPVLGHEHEELPLPPSPVTRQSLC